MSSFIVNNIRSPGVHRKLGYQRVAPLQSRRVTATGSITSRKTVLRQRWRGKLIIVSQQTDKDFDEFIDVNQRIIDSQIDPDSDTSYLDPETELHHQQLLTKFTRMSRATPMEVRYWQQFGYPKMPPDVAEAFHRWSLFTNKKAKKMIRRGRGKKGAKIPEVQPPHPMIYLCEKYPKCCPVKYRRLTVQAQQYPDKLEFWWARGFWDGIPKDVQEYLEKYEKMTYVERLKAVSMKQYVQLNYPEIQLGKRSVGPYFERDEFPEMLKRESLKLQKRLQAPDIPRKHRNSRKNLVLVTWEIVLQERKVKEEELKKLMERKQEEKQRHKIMERFQLEVQTPKVNQSQKRNSRNKLQVQNNRKLLVVKQSQKQNKDKLDENSEIEQMDDKIRDKHVDKLREILDQI